MLLAACATGTGPRGITVEGGLVFDVVTLNVGRGEENWPARLEAIVAGLQPLDPEVVCLEEVLQDPGRNQAEMIADRLGLHATFASEDSTASQGLSGTAILTKAPAVESGHEALDPTTDDRVIVHARIAPDKDTMDVYCTHLHAAEEGGDIRRRQILDALEYIDETRSDGPVFFAGSFNATVDAPEIRTLHDRFQDGYGTLRPDTGGSVTTVNPENGQEPRRIDHIFFRSGIWNQVVPDTGSIVLDQRTAAGAWPSDHYGVWVRFRIRSWAEPGPRQERSVGGPETAGSAARVAAPRAAVDEWTAAFGRSR